MMKDIEELFSLTLKKKGIIGGAIGVIENGRTHYFCSGVQSVETNQPVSTKSLFEIGSLTKVFSTLLLLRLTSEKIVDLDEPIDTFLPICPLPHFEGQKITLRHLATHSSGLPTLPTAFQPKDLNNPYLDYLISDLYSFLKNHTLTKPPGQTFVYSNIGMGLLAHILCQKMEMDFGSLLNRYILGPLSMTQTSISIAKEMKDLLCSGHKLGRITPYWNCPESIIGACGIYSNIEDMTRFLALNLDLIDSPLTDLVKSCHQPIHKTPIPNEWCGLGWISTEKEQGSIVWHDGITGGFASFIGLNPLEKRGVVILTNMQKAWLNQFSFKLLNV